MGRKFENVYEIVRGVYVHHSKGQLGEGSGEVGRVHTHRRCAKTLDLLFKSLAESQRGIFGHELAHELHRAVDFCNFVLRSILLEGGAVNVENIFCIIVYRRGQGKAGGICFERQRRIRIVDVDILFEGGLRVGRELRLAEGPQCLGGSAVGTCGVAAEEF